MDEDVPEPLHRRWEFASTDAHALAHVREEVDDFLRAAGGPQSDFQAARVTLVELVANAVLHAPPGRIEVRIDWTERRPVLRVTDGGRGFTPRIALPAADHVAGRGLYLIAHLADKPRVESGPEGCSVSVRLPVRRALVAPDDSDR